MKSIGFARREELREERLGTFVPSIHSGLVCIKPLFRSPQERERKQTEPDCIFRYTLDNKSTAKLQELLEMRCARLAISTLSHWLARQRLNYTTEKSLSK